MRPLLSILLFAAIITPTIISLLFLAAFARPGISSPVGPLTDQSLPNDAPADPWDIAEEETLRYEQHRADVERLRQEAANRTAYENTQKYFHEPASHEIGADDRLGHYDSRFFKKQLGEEEKHVSQVHMVRAFLEIFRERGVETWLAHGTLLGWYWNGKVRGPS